MNTNAEKDQFFTIIQSNKKLIFKVCNSYCKDIEDRKDLVQEVIIRLWQSFEKYNNQYKLSTWIYRIALNTAISHYRSGRRRKENTLPLQENLIDLADHIPETGMDDRIGQLYKMIGSMDEMKRALMILYLDNNSYKDIAEILGISESNVATKISRIKQQLKLQFLKN